MLSQVLKRQFVINLLDEVQSELTRPHDERHGGSSSLLNENTAADVLQTVHELEAARQRELAVSPEGEPVLV